ncbi:MAG: tetratricopeptide repeat protein [Clostridia bacterium]|nr:tetratricopeptide repeat protein [Clostridia bacterium]
MAIDLARIYDKLESLFARHDLVAAEQLLLYWRDEAVALGDEVGEKQIDNELLGLYRRTDEREKALAVAERLLPRLSPDNVGDATIRLNLATDYCHFGLPERALPLYREVEAVYLAHLAADDYRLASLYNNMASYAMTTKDYREAEATYQKALDVLSRIEPPLPETAVTLVNLATAAYHRNPLDRQVDERMLAAYDLLMTPSMPRDGNFAFVLSKVIPIFEHLGYREQTATLKALLAFVEETV